jgi:hypothetical protein
MVLGVTAAAVAVFRELSNGSAGKPLKSYRVYLVVAAGIIVMFLSPILIEMIDHHPNNVDYIERYLDSHSGVQNSMKASAVYLVSFFTYYAHPESVLSTSPPRFRDVMNSQPYLRIYWGLLLLLAVFALANTWRRQQRAGTFVK